MSQVTSSYNPAALVKSVTSVALSVTETELLNTTDAKFLAKTQMTAFFDADLTATPTAKVKIRYYVTADKGANPVWYEVPIKDLTTVPGELKDIPSLIDSNSPSYASNKYRLVEDIPLSACMGFRVTAQMDSGTATMNTCTLMARDN